MIDSAKQLLKTITASSLQRIFRSRVVVVGLLAAWVSLLLAGQASAAAPTLSRLFPAGGQRGTKVAVTCTGSFSWPVMVRAPGVEAVVGAEAGKLEISIPQDLAADRVWVRLYNEEGASSAAPFLIGALKETNDQEPNNSPQAPQTLMESEVTINGDLQGADVDGFAMQLSAGQTLVAALDAHGRLGSPMDAILQVASPEGFVLAENHDDVGLDPRLAFTAKTSGMHIVRLFAFPSEPDTTIAFRGGAEYIYRLTLTTGAYITHAVPLSAGLDEPGAVAVHGWNIPPNTTLPVVPFGGGRLAEAQEFESLADLRNFSDAQLGFAFSPNLAGGARVRLSPHAVVPGLGATNADKPIVLAPPTAVTGWLRTPRQADQFRVPLKAGQQTVIAIESRSLGFPLDPVLELSDPAGTVVANVNNLAPVRASVLTQVAAVDGDYTLKVRDRFRQGGERGFYRLTVRLEETDFELSTSVDALVVAPDKPTELTVSVQRRAGSEGAVGPITIEVADLPPGVSAPAVISEVEGPTASTVTLSFTTTGPAFSGPIRIVGTATQPKEIKRQARTPLNFGATFETLWLTAVAKP